MQNDLIAAAVQMCSSENKEANWLVAERLVRRAVDERASFVVLPEYFNCLGDRRVMLREAEPLDGPTAAFLCELASSLRITLVGGSFCERTSDPEKAHNTSLVVDPSGRVVAVYRKLHLFDVELPGKLTYRESTWLTAGSDVVQYEAAGCRAASAICYDLRFPELFRLFADGGVELIALPAAFTRTTGTDHWELLIRARAVENQCYIAAANQTGRHATLETYGHSLICDPWGVVLADAGETEGVAVARLSCARLAEVRGQLPALRHRRELPSPPNRAAP